MKRLFLLIVGLAFVCFAQASDSTSLAEALKAADVAAAERLLSKGVLSPVSWDDMPPAEVAAYFCGPWQQYFPGAESILVFCADELREEGVASVPVPDCDRWLSLVNDLRDQKANEALWARVLQHAKSIEEGVGLPSGLSKARLLRWLVCLCVLDGRGCKAGDEIDALGGVWQEVSSSLCLKDRVEVREQIFSVLSPTVKSVLDDVVTILVLSGPEKTPAYAVSSIMHEDKAWRKLFPEVESTLVSYAAAVDGVPAVEAARYYKESPWGAVFGRLTLAGREAALDWAEPSETRFFKMLEERIGLPKKRLMRWLLSTYLFNMYAHGELRENLRKGLQAEVEKCPYLMKDPTARTKLLEIIVAKDIFSLPG